MRFVVDVSNVVLNAPVAAVATSVVVPLDKYPAEPVMFCSASS